jgi:hypothetical protein
MHRTELCFRALHERIIWLEERQAWQGPSDEQVERVLRKILAERFADGNVQQVQSPNIMKEEDYFVEDRRNLGILRPVAIDPASLFVEPDAVPSKAYVETFNMLERHLADFPDVDLRRTPPHEARDVKMNYDIKQSKSSDGV